MSLVYVKRKIPRGIYKHSFLVAVLKHITLAKFPDSICPFGAISKYLIQYPYLKETDFLGEKLRGLI